LFWVPHRGPRPRGHPRKSSFLGFQKNPRPGVGPRKIEFRRPPKAPGPKGSSEIFIFGVAQNSPRHDVAPRKIVVFERLPRLQGPTWLLGKIRFFEEAPRKIAVSGARFFCIFANLSEMNRYLIHFFDVLKPEL
jgi:hypothetical protein